MKASKIGCDSSVLVSAYSPLDVPKAAQCREALPHIEVLPAHVLLETFRVLTSLPGTARVPPQTAVKLLSLQTWNTVQLPADAYLSLIKRFAVAGRSGGAIYDAQIAATAKHHGMKLLSNDHRAAGTYDLMGIEYELI